jgi:hypothetical protein
VLRFAGLPASLAQTALLHLFRSRSARFHSAFFVHNALGRSTGEAFVLASVHVARSFPRRIRLPPPGAHAPCATSSPLVLVVAHSLAALQEDYERRELVGRWVGWPGEKGADTRPRGGPTGRGAWGARATAGDVATGGGAAWGGGACGGGEAGQESSTCLRAASGIRLDSAVSAPAASPPPRLGFTGDRPRECASAGAASPRLGGDGLTGAAVGMRTPSAPVCIPSAGIRPAAAARPRPSDRQLIRVIRTTPAAVGDVCRPPLFHPADKAPASAPPPGPPPGPVARGIRASGSHPFFWRARAYAPYYAGRALTRLDPCAAALARMQV